MSAGVFLEASNSVRVTFGLIIGNFLVEVEQVQTDLTPPRLVRAG